VLNCLLCGLIAKPLLQFNANHLASTTLGNLDSLHPATGAKINNRAATNPFEEASPKVRSHLVSRRLVDIN